MATGNLDLQISVTNAGRAALRVAIGRMWEMMTPYQRAMYRARSVVDERDHPTSDSLNDIERYEAHKADVLVMRFCDAATKHGGTIGRLLTVEFMADHPGGGTLDQVFARVWPQST